MRYFVRAWTLLKQRGVKYALYLLQSYWTEIVFRLLLLWPQLRRLAPSTSIARKQHQARALSSLPNRPSPVCWADWPLHEETRVRVEAARALAPDSEIVIGRLDKDGRVLGLFGELPMVINISENEFVKRERFSLDIVLVDDHVLIRKDFQGKRAPFLREWLNLAILQGKANVPNVYRADEEHCILYKNLLPWRTLRDVLVEAGADILSVSTEVDPTLAHLDSLARIQAVWARGREVFPKCLPAHFLQQLEAQLNQIHAAGVAKLSLTFGNIMIDDQGNPWLLDFEGSQAFPSTRNLIIRLYRDEDRRNFNDIYGGNLMTEQSARMELAAQNADRWYAPIDFGNGLATHGFWSIDNGTGRWEYFNQHVMPSLEGCRVLDLGANNGAMPMMMLRAGAREVIGLELSEVDVTRARLVHRIFEWQDMCRYPFQIHNCDMREILHTDWGKFDIVTSFCTLYYLPEEDMAKVVRRAAELAPVLVVQANEHTRDEAADNKAEKSSVLFLTNLLTNNGFSKIQVVAPPGYSRPLLIARMI